MNQDYQDPLKIYQEQFKEIYAVIKNRDRGCLYEAIAYLDPENSEDICHYFGIDKNSTLDNDFKFCKPFLSSPIKDLFIFQIPFLKEIAQIPEAMEFPNFLVPIQDNNGMFTVIIIVAFILPALYYIAVKQSEQRRKLNKDRNIRQPQVNRNIREPQVKARDRYLYDYQPRLTGLSRKPSVLCLVVPSHQFSGLNPGLQIPSSRVKKLISSASYFLCDGSVQAIEQKVNLNFSGSSINFYSEEYAYIQLIIPEGEGMIAQETKYSLKKKLPDGDAKINKIARLINLDGLENFICA
ncbi:MAG: hypothetical protein F6K37_14000 [Moorea sp. SIO4E2]|uniref:hypothetical protein n=1 Tax=Moorena sp. SIO4E2 TaxID=2607826 RepID=UPI0013BE89CF|nr:hypothetical protein [Moorena sp. SIO4E2]NEQ07008.1 hypothetical protein [Moorena sp. SIO4E2]